MGLFLILTVIATTALRKTNGLPVKIAAVWQGAICDGPRMVVLHCSTNGVVTLNGEKLKRSGIESRLREVFDGRVERRVFIEADLDVPFQEVAAVIDSARNCTDSVAILTRTMASKPGCLTVAIPPFPEYVRPVVEMNKIPWWRWRL
ncbi:MAG: biopolymer transporter ExbD [Bryobacteraceae bacterium]